eukprot:TRINITY_DN6415_c0_g1_i2.p1 TRINITY_DN6415_c0_g1~~TRINITY_DN6415_c0_g1_i2.p1  ORF type:complete len:238 (-),score=38.00 TRINITY_DN6415_c0_g1_i2:78-716(-)
MDGQQDEEHSRSSASSLVHALRRTAAAAAPSTPRAQVGHSHPSLAEGSVTVPPVLWRQQLLDSARDQESRGYGATSCSRATQGHARKHNLAALRKAEQLAKLDFFGEKADMEQKTCNAAADEAPKQVAPAAGCHRSLGPSTCPRKAAMSNSPHPGSRPASGTCVRPSSQGRRLTPRGVIPFGACVPQPPRAPPNTARPFARSGGSIPVRRVV